MWSHVILYIGWLALNSRIFFPQWNSGYFVTVFRLNVVLNHLVFWIIGVKQPHFPPQLKAYLHAYYPGYIICNKNKTVTRQEDRIYFETDYRGLEIDLRFEEKKTLSPGYVLSRGSWSQVASWLIIFHRGFTTILYTDLLGLHTIFQYHTFRDKLI